MSSIINIVRDKFLEAIRSVQPPGRWKAFVVDEHSKRLLLAVLKANDILAENVTAIDDISNYREPQPQQEAIYILMPTTKNVERIMADFSNGMRQYAKAHLFFIDGLPDPLLQRLASSPAEPHLAGLQDLYLNINAIESQVFTLREPSTFFSMYSPPRNPSLARAARDRLMEDLRMTCKMICNLLVTLNEYPFIRYYVPPNHPPLGPLAPSATQPHGQPHSPPPQQSEGSLRWRTNLARGSVAREREEEGREYVSKVLAWMVQGELDEYKKTNPEWPKPDSGRPRGTLLITDRSMDAVAPFIHEFTYQAMANDLLPIDDGRFYRYKFQSSAGAFEDKTAELTDEDTVWTEVRHMHMRDAIDKLMADFNKFLQENAGFKGEGAVSLEMMQDMLANLPQYQEQRERFSVHLNMAQECMDIFEKKKLTALATVEQNSATGLTPEGKTPKTLVEEMVPLLDSRDVSGRDKVRIIALYIQHREGVPDEDKRRLYQHARLSIPEQDAVNALVHLGVRIVRGPLDKDFKKKIKPKVGKDEEYDLSRYKPLLDTVLEEHVAEKLDDTVFPYVKDSPVTSRALASSTSLRTTASNASAASGLGSGSPGGASLRSARAGWARAKPTGPAAVDVRQRLIVFVAGGMTYSEMRGAYQKSAALNKDVIIGSTHIFTPEAFIDDLKVIELQGSGSRACPNGLREMHGERPFQAYYDEKYFTRDPPPPRGPSGGGAPQGGRNAPSRGGGAPAMSSNNSYASTRSNASGGGPEVEKKKKGRLFRF